MSRKSLRRALTLAAATPLAAGALLTGAPAASATHQTIPACDPALSTRVFTGEILGQPSYVWIQPINASETRICIGSTPDRLVIGLDSGVYVTPVSVVRTQGVGNCGTEVFDIDDPGRAQLSFNFSTAPAICWGVDDVTTTITLKGPSVDRIPSIAVWRGGGGWVDLAMCADYYALWAADGLSYDSYSYQAYESCFYYPARIV